MLRTYIFKKKRADNQKISISEKGLTKSLEKNIAQIQSFFAGDEMFVTRRLQNKYLPTAKCCIFYLEPMADGKRINKEIVWPFLDANLKEVIDKDNLLDELLYKVIAANNIEVVSDVDAIIDAIFVGDTVFLLDNYTQALVINSKGWETRAVTEPDTDKVLRGPREGFTESIKVNLSLIRRKIKDPALTFKFREVGKRTKTKVCVSYIKGIASDEVLTELDERLNRIKIDGILDSGYIQELIRDARLSPFETVGSSEKPDVIAGKMLEGRVAIFVDGSPFVLTVPFVAAETTQSSEDYYNNYIFASINRLLRSLAIFTSFITPGLYLALANYHQEMLPTPLLLSIAASRQGVPFPTALSMFLMLLMFDILREASTRMPTPIGQTVNIVGTLVLGQAAVEARLVSAPIVIVTALSCINTLFNPGLMGATIVICTFFLFGSMFLGIYGLIFSFILVVLHLMNIRSFGVPYFLNITTLANHNGQDVWVRAPWWKMLTRPKLIGAQDPVRQSTPESRLK